ncbi:hypothetical protein [Salsipaludibacter albus]|uniref:hypothetical protein n=1 Tax=Salsipaludibacter albus TaxID=2849650 RepID=UPI001EE42F06|nr:hypothetical protein [Salsipaludibacter albus]MBY5162430.1 hypothetical protein [Salsipaludibacter albus]
MPAPSIRRIACVATCAVLVAACSTSADDEDATPTPMTTDAATSAAPTTPATPLPTEDVPEDPEASAASPLPNSVLSNTLAELPLPSGAAPSGPPVTEGTTIQQTFRVQDDDPEAVFERFFLPELADAGWDVVEDVQPRGDGAAATWVRDELELQLVTQEGPEEAEVVLNVLLSQRG